jgi:hypothetical protein
MALAVVEAEEEEMALPHPATAALTLMLAQLGEATADALGGVDDEASEADLVDQIGLLERLRGAVAACQAAAMVRLARTRVARETALRHRPGTIGRGLAEEIGLACHLSPSVAARRLGAARALWSDLPRTYAALAAGRLSERVALHVVSETRHLDPMRRREVDQHLHRPRSADGEAGVDLTTMGVRQALAATAKVAYQADPRAYVERGRTERDDRHVTLRPAPDTMSWLSGYLPVEQGVACLAALKKHTDGAVAAGDERSRGQIMADTLVERLTGQTTASDVNVDIQLIVPASSRRPSADDATLHDADTADDADGSGDPNSAGHVWAAGAATLTGVGHLPIGLARQLVDASAGAKHLRRLHQTAEGHLVDIGARRRFTGALADLIVARDQTCREPFCDAPIRHLDHVQRHTDGGATTLANGRGLCARHNLTREHPGWHATVIHDGHDTQPHTVLTTTPTGHTYQGRAPDPP